MSGVAFFVGLVVGIAVGIPLAVVFFVASLDEAVGEYFRRRQ